MSVPPRTNVGLVQGVLGQDYDMLLAPDLRFYITGASAVVDRVALYAARADVNKPLSATELEQVERWLAAHMYVTMDKTYASKTTAGGSASFDGKTGLNCDGSRYGQMAKVLDYSGGLTIIDKRQVASATWLGKPPSAQIPYIQRN